MDYFIEILKYLGPFIGVLIGWLLTRKSETDKVKYSESKQVKRSLYVLLEIRNQLVVSKRIERFINALTKQLNESGLTDEALSSEQLNEFIKKILPSLIGESFQKDLKVQFAKCIDNLSEIDPILAYRINGKQNIQDYINSWENESNSLFEIENIEDFRNAMTHFKPKLINEIKSDLESIIQEIAALIGKGEIQYINGLIQEPEDQDIQADVNEYLEKMFQGLI